MTVILRETIAQSFLERVKLEPNRKALFFKPSHPSLGPLNEWTGITFRDFFHQSRFLSFGIKATLNLPNNSPTPPRVLLCSSPRLEWPITDLAIMGAGAVTVPLFINSHVSDWKIILNQCKPDLVFLETHVQLEKFSVLFQNKSNDCHKPNFCCILDPTFDSQVHESSSKHSDIQKLDIKILTFKSLIETGKNEEPKDPTLFEKTLSKLRPQDEAMICYTSGTSGSPKGVCLTHQNIMSVMNDTIRVLFTDAGADPSQERILSFLPFSHIMGKVESMSVWTFGWEQYFAEHFDKLSQNLRETKPTFLFCVPRVFEAAFEQIKQKIDSSSFTKQGFSKAMLEASFETYDRAWRGEKLSWVQSLTLKFTRTLLRAIVVQHFGGNLRAAFCGGAPLSVELNRFFWAIGINLLEGYGLTETCAPISMNTPKKNKPGSVGIPLPEVAIKIEKDGEILVKSDKLFSGYLNSPEETSLVLKNGWLHTGDIGHVDSEGFLFITDRKKDLIITSTGRNIAPQKIENLAKRFSFFKEFYVYGDHRHFISALITLNREEVISFATKEVILFSHYEELLKNPKVIERVQTYLDELNTAFSPYEQIKRFALLSDEFSVETGELTPSLKVKRQQIALKHKDTLDRLYQSS